MITYRRMHRSEQARFAEVDRSERITQAYRQHGRELELVAVDWLAEALFAYARAQGAMTLYVTTTPTPSTGEFYLGLGFESTDDPLPTLLEVELELEPDDIHMRMTIRAD